MNAAPWFSEAEEVVWLRVGDALPSAARREGSGLARRIGLSAHRASEIELALTEAATNLQRHAVDGALALRLVRTRDRAAVEFLALDSGPGIADVPHALTDGSSTRGTLGVGLGAIARLADDFDIHSLPGRGTALSARFWSGPAHAGRPAGASPAVEASGLTRPISGEEVCGDTWAVRGVPGDTHEDTVVLALMCDGLGHGPQAARAGEAARTAFRETTATGPQGVLVDLHRALRATRGAAVAVARVDAEEGTVDFCGVGNISAFLVGDTRTALLSSPGIVGHQLPRLRSARHRLERGSVLVMHSDGLSDRWAPADFPGLFGRGASVIGAQLLQQTGVRRDDAGVLTAKVVRRPPERRAPEGLSP
ncbi:ATP-binding SpoIIE family protein phosphatase [Streptomyces sp. NPDC026672]|uniref:ATP-binding SpoIIE family protein phosphatase n=1 Tax=unclassified Streptomyces TaxID=2593676 RepID=UPI003401CEA5